MLQGTKKAQNILPVFGEHTDRPRKWDKLNRMSLGNIDLVRPKEVCQQYNLFKDHELSLNDSGVKSLLFGSLSKPMFCCYCCLGVFVFYVEKYDWSEVLSLGDLWQSLKRIIMDSLECSDFIGASWAAILLNIRSRTIIIIITARL